MPDIQGAMSRKRAAELELLFDIERELLMPVPPAPPPSPYATPAYGVLAHSSTADPQLPLF